MTQYANTVNGATQHGQH